MALASNKVMDALKGIGLNLYERRLWVALLARGTSTAGELSEITSVPRSRTYDILQSLAEKGFVTAQPSKPLKYVAIAPDEGLERAKKKLQEDFKAVQERMDDLKSSPVLKELNEIFSKGLKIVSPGEFTGTLKGQYSLHQQLTTMFKDADKKINILTTSEGMNELAEHHFDVLKKASDKGVDIKILATDTEKCVDAIKTLGGLAEIRNVNGKEVPISGRFAVVDSKELIFSLTDHKTVHATQDLAMWSKSEHAAKEVLEPLFKLAWNSSKAVG